MHKVKNSTAWNAIKQLPIGTKVMVSAELVQADDVAGRVDYKTDPPAEYPHVVSMPRIWRARACKPFVAWISGARWCCEGALKTTYFYDYSAPTHGSRFVTNNKIPALLVRKAQFSKEIIVPVDAVEEIVLSVTAPRLMLAEAAPLMQTTPCSDAAREYLRERSKAAARGQGGKFLPSAPTPTAETPAPATTWSWARPI
ncbi:MAG: hypothetical protein WC505_07030 [Patescibacteria group bacterium]